MLVNNYKITIFFQIFFIKNSQFLYIEDLVKKQKYLKYKLPMSFNNIYELYNNSLISETKKANIIVDNIKSKIEEAVAAGTPTRFLYDTYYFLSTENTLAIDRIIDLVIKSMRTQGLRVRKQVGYNGFTADVSSFPTFSGTLQINGEFSLDFNDDFLIYEEVTYTSDPTKNTILIVEWYVRYRQEYMKHYC